VTAQAGARPKKIICSVQRNPEHRGGQLLVSVSAPADACLNVVFSSLVERQRRRRQVNLMGGKRTAQIHIKEAESLPRVAVVQTDSAR